MKKLIWDGSMADPDAAVMMGLLNAGYRPLSPSGGGSEFSYRSGETTLAAFKDGVLEMPDDVYGKHFDDRGKPRFDEKGKDKKPYIEHFEPEKPAKASGA